MGARAGTIDPGVVPYLLRREESTPDGVERLDAGESGLLSESGISSDLCDLQNSAAPQGDEAVDLFRDRVGGEIGAMVTALEGLDALVFTGRIGENSPDVREQVCDRLGRLDVAFDPAANRSSSPPQALGSPGLRLARPDGRAGADREACGKCARALISDLLSHTASP